MSVRELSKYIFTTRYSNFVPGKNRRETWGEAVKRQIGMHRIKYPNLDPKEIDEIEQAVLDKRVLGSQRALQFGGEPILKKNARMFNCAFSYADRVEFFQQVFWLLLCGCGTGFSVQQHHVADLPKLRKDRDDLKLKWYRVEDSIEGWANSVGVLVSSYFETDATFPEYQNTIPHFDLSNIRKEGSYLSSSSGKAPGPEPLRLALRKIRALLDKVLEEGRDYLKPIEVYDIVMFLAEAVLSGGIRRSATICLFSYEDEEMMNAKTGNWWKENPQRSKSNNSIVIVRNTLTREQFHDIFERTKQFGEPGIFLTAHRDIGCNPCAEIGFYCYIWREGKRETVWGFCNLSEIVGKYCDTEEEFYYACEMAARLGTLQSGYTDFSYLGEATEWLARNEPLLGVSITGMMDNPNILFDPRIQRRGAEIVRKENERVAPLIGVKPGARNTTIKPSGTAAGLVETASGIHCHPHTRYIRNVQSNIHEEPYKVFKSVNPLATEQSVYDKSGKTDTISFCVEVPDGAKTKAQVNAIDLLNYVKLTYENWVKPGTVEERCLFPGVTHSVSNTIHVKDHEWNSVEEFIFNNQDSLAGISMTSDKADKDYAQAPFQNVYTPREQISMYGDASLFASGMIEKALEVYDDLWVACDDVLFQNQGEVAAVKKFREKVTKFANNYFEGDIRKATYCMKDVYLWKKFVDLKREYKSVNYQEIVELQDNTNYAIDTQACAGGVCDVI